MPVLVALAACSVQKKKVLETESPGDAATATLIEETGGGAAVSTMYHLYLSDRSNARGQLVFDATYCGGISLAWQGTNTLVLQYLSGCYIHSFRNMWWSKMDLANASGPTVEIVLVRKPGAASGS